ncbi:MAG: GNAT family N-acetyltransferase [Terracoccus sp.]
MAFTPVDRLVRVQAHGVLLRAYEPQDAPDLLEAFADNEIARWNPGPSGADAAADFMARRNDWGESTHASWAVADASGRLVGSVSVHQIDPDQADAEIGYWVAPWARQQGHATRAVVAASRFAFFELGLHRLYLYHAVDNPSSCAVARAAGFAHEGTLRKSFRYADDAYHDEHLHGLLAGDSSAATTP